MQSLAASASNPLTPSDLELDGEPFAPVDVESLGAELIEAGEPVLDGAPAVDETHPGDGAHQRGRSGRAVHDAFAADAAAASRPARSLGPQPEEAPPPRALAAAGLRPLAAALAHELRSPLTGIKTFAELLAERWTDAEFRARFAERTGEDVRRIETSLERLAQLASFGPPAPESVDVTALLGELLEARRDLIRERRLLVLQELDTQHPAALRRSRAAALRARCAARRVLLARPGARRRLSRVETPRGGPARRSDTARARALPRPPARLARRTRPGRLPGRELARAGARRARRARAAGQLHRERSAGRRDARRARAAGSSAGEPAPPLPGSGGA